MRETYLDTETTGGSKDDRVIDLGIVEVVNGEITGRRINTLVYTDRPIHWAAHKVHGIKAADLIGKPSFLQLSEEALDFIGDAPCFAHNARFDAGMMNREFARAGVHQSRWPRIYCTMPIASAIVSGPIGMDALIAHYFPDRPPRGKHRAAEDAELLARVVLRMKQDAPNTVARVLRNMDAVRFPKPLGAEEVLTRPARVLGAQMQKKPVAPLSSPEAVNAGVAEKIREANALNSAELAIKIRTGRDAFSVANLSEITPFLKPGCRETAATLDHPSRVLASLRMMARGLNPDLAVARELHFASYIEKAKEAEGPSFAY